MAAVVIGFPGGGAEWEGLGGGEGGGHYSRPMYEISVETEFCAAHAIVIAGLREPVHGHNWRVTVTVGGERLDSEGLLLDFHALERLVAEIIGPFRNQDLNATPPFDRVNPTAELVARHIGDRVQGGLAALAAPPQTAQIRVTSVRVTEAPGCAVVYRP
jgi:6-pyruvoyltetrahydropterin/6-carboxytetrahydropterin synthase